MSDPSPLSHGLTIEAAPRLHCTGEGSFTSNDYWFLFGDQKIASLPLNIRDQVLEAGSDDFPVASPDVTTCNLLNAFSPNSLSIIVSSGILMFSSLRHFLISPRWTKLWTWNFSVCKNDVKSVCKLRVRRAYPKIQIQWAWRTQESAILTSSSGVLRQVDCRLHLEKLPGVCVCGGCGSGKGLHRHRKVRGPAW